MKITDGVEMLEISSINVMGKSAMNYPVILWDESTVILVDTGLPGQLPQLRQSFDAAGVDFNSLNKIIITHHDIDHIGNLSAIIKALPGKTAVLAHEAEIPYISGEKVPLKIAALEDKLDILPENMKEFYFKIKGVFPTCTAPVDEALQDGQELLCCGGIKVIFTPGHTLGHICLYLKKSKTLIAGDLLRIVDNNLMKADPSINYDTELSNKSLNKLLEYDIKSVICYHGGFFNDNVNQRIAELAAT